LISSDISRYRGSTLKVKNQIEVWREKGHTVEVFARVPDLSPSLLKANRFVKQRSFFKDIFLLNKKFIQAVSAFDPDIIYIRQSFPNRTYYYLQRKYKNIIEIVSDEVEEYKYLFLLHKSISTFLKLSAIFFMRIPFIKAATGLLAGTKEVAVKERYNRYCKNISVVPNSVSINEDGSDIIKQENRASQADSISDINLFFIGSPGFTWHGIDKIEKLAEILGDLFIFHIVGLNGQNKSNVKYYGYLDESKYNKIMMNCDVCISTFALHRKQQNECTTIKFCEYLKKGFPVIVPYRETSVVQNGVPEWILELPNQEDVIDLPGVKEKISKFCHDYKHKIVSHEEAAPYIDSFHIEQKRLDFLSASLNSARMPLTERD
jgi:hypothetical protein